jgi:hypothetical protein
MQGRQSMSNAGGEGEGEGEGTHNGNKYSNSSSNICKGSYPNVYLWSVN